MSQESLTLPESVMCMIDSAGANPVGLQPGEGKAPALALFLDPKTGTTLALPLGEVTTAAVRLHMDESRKTF